MIIFTKVMTRDGIKLAYKIVRLYLIYYISDEIDAFEIDLYISFIKIDANNSCPSNAKYEETDNEGSCS